MPVVVDTDLSTDDVVALLYLVQRDDVDLRAVAASGTGLVHCPPGARHVLELLAAAGRLGVPVACGPADPLAGYNQFPAEWRSGADELFGLPLTLVPLDATNDVPVTEMLADTLSRHHYASPAASLAWELFLHAGMHDGRQYFWGPLAAAALTEPELLTFEEKRPRVQPVSGRVVETADGSPVRVG